MPQGTRGGTSAVAHIVEDVGMKPPCARSSPTVKVVPCSEDTNFPRGFSTLRSPTRVCANIEILRIVSNIPFLFQYIRKWHSRGGAGCVLVLPKLEIWRGEDIPRPAVQQGVLGSSRFARHFILEFGERSTGEQPFRFKCDLFCCCQRVTLERHRLSGTHLGPQCKLDVQTRIFQ